MYPFQCQEMMTMTQITITNLDPTLLESLRQRAAEHGLSPEEEAKTILTAVLQPDRLWASIDEIRQRIACNGLQQTDSALLLREDRNR